MKKLLSFIPSIIFNLAESLIIILIGLLLEIDIRLIILLIILFAILRMSFGKAMHYKDWYRCLVWSTLVFLSLFVVAKVDLMICIILTIFAAYILTGKGNINDMYMWKNNKPSKYYDIEEYIKYHSLDSLLLDFESKLKSQDNLDFLIYKYRFKDNMTFSEIVERLDLDNPRIVEKLDKIAFAMRLYCGI